MTDILLTHSNHLYYDPKQVRKMQPYPPLGTLYAAALLRERGFSVAVFDSMLQDPEQGFSEALTRHRPRVVHPEPRCNAVDVSRVVRNASARQCG